jgi:hypothetical protein
MHGSHIDADMCAYDFLQNSDHITISAFTIKRLKRKRREALLPPRPQLLGVRRPSYHEPTPNSDQSA